MIEIGGRVDLNEKRIIDKVYEWHQKPNALIVTIGHVEAVGRRQRY